MKIILDDYDMTIKIETPNVRYTEKFRQRDGLNEILRILQKTYQYFEKQRISLHCLNRLTH